MSTRETHSCHCKKSHYLFYPSRKIQIVSKLQVKFVPCVTLYMFGVFVGQENGKSRLEQTKEDVEDVKVIMLDNLNKADERAGKLNELEDRADVLLEKVMIW